MREGVPAVPGADDPSVRLASLLLDAAHALDLTPRAALTHAEEATRLARALDDDAGLCEALRLVAEASRRLALYPEAVGASLEAIALVPHDAPALQADLWHGAAIAQLRLANYRDALEYSELSLRLARQADDRLREQQALEAIALVHHEVGDDGRALEVLEAQIASWRAEGDRSRLGRSLAHVGMVRLGGGAARQATTSPTARETARELLLDAAGIARETGDERLLAFSLAHLAEAQLALGDVSTAEVTARDALARVSVLEDRHEQAVVRLTLGRAALAQGDTAAARERFAEVLEAAHAIGARDLLVAAHLALSELHERLGDPASALVHHRRYHELEAALRSESAERRTQAASSRLDLQRSRHETEQERQRNAELERLVRHRTRQLQEAQLEMLELLAGAAEFRDAPLGPHTRWVGETSAGVARALGFPEDEAADLGLAARLHDVGKIGIPDHILLKAGPLTPEEWQVMRTHTTLGAHVLERSAAPLLRLAREIALTHHERWDGLGYPRGLRGENIPLAGRIVSVVDTFDALRTERSYKPAWSQSDALTFLEAQAGVMFDPRVVAAFVRLCRDGQLPPTEV